MPDLQADFAFIRQCLQKERHMREWVFRNNAANKAEKTREIDSALDALERIEQAVGKPQRDLFDHATTP